MMDDGLREVLIDWFEDNFECEKGQGREDVEALEELIEQEGHEITKKMRRN